MRTLLLPLLLMAAAMHAQPFLIGSRSITYFDAARNRDIATNLFYPGVTAGSNAQVAPGAFPVLVIGHGFVMSPDAYANLWEHFVPKGYIVALPTTEGGFAPDHADFGADIAFLAQALQAADSDAGSPFFGHVAPETALMGHSMGGGAALLGAAGNGAITTVVGLAAAETNPSAVAACASITVPALIMAGSNDCITPIADHQGPMYDALTMPCRAFVSINGGGHCYFAESNFNCSFGELTCLPSPAITRAQQHDAVNDIAGLWLDHFLLGDQQALPDLLDSLALSARLTGEHTCSITTSMAAQEEVDWQAVYDAQSDRLLIRGLPAGCMVRLLDPIGREALPARLASGEASLEVRGLAAAIYHVVVDHAGARQVRAVALSR